MLNESEAKLGISLSCIIWVWRWQQNTTGVTKVTMKSRKTRSPAARIRKVAKKVLCNQIKRGSWKHWRLWLC